MPLPHFDATISGGIIKPIIDALHRFSGVGSKSGIIDVTPDRVRIETGGFDRVVATLPRESFDRYDVQAVGEGSFDIDQAWSNLDEFVYGDDIRIWTEETDNFVYIHFGEDPGSLDSVKLREDTEDVLADLSAPWPDSSFGVMGDELGDKVRALDLIDGNLTVVFGVDDGRAVAGTRSGEEEILAQFATSEAPSSDAMTTTASGTLRQVTIPIPRPASTDVHVEIEDGGPLSFEYDVDGAEVLVVTRKRQRDESIRPGVFDFSDVVEEVTVPDEPRRPAPATEPPVRQGSVIGKCPNGHPLSVENIAPDDVVEATCINGEFQVDIPFERFEAGTVDIGGATIDVEAEEPEPEPEPEPEELTADEIENIVSRATAGVDVRVIGTGDNLREIRMEKPPNSTAISESRVNTFIEDDRREAVERGVGRWEEFAILRNVDVTDLNQRRAEVNREYGFDFPSLTPPEPPATVDVPQRLEPSDEPEPEPEPEPGIDPSEPATETNVETAFPELPVPDFLTGFDTLQDILDAPISEVLDLYGVGEGTVEAIIERPVPNDTSTTIGAARGKPLGEVDVPRETEAPEAFEGSGSVMIRPINGRMSYSVAEMADVPNDVEVEVINAAENVLGPPEQFDPADIVGGFTYTGRTLVEVTFDRGEDLLGGDVGRPEATIDDQLYSRLQTAMLRANFPVGYPPARIRRRNDEIVTDPAVTDEWQIHLRVADLPRFSQPADWSDDEFFIYYLQELRSALVDEDRGNVDLSAAEEVFTMAPDRDIGEPDVRSVGEIEDAVQDAIGTGGPEPEPDTTAPDTGDGGGEAFIRRMIENDNRVMRNQFGLPIVELVAPRTMTDVVFDLLDTWDINPMGPDVVGQDPSFTDERPEVAGDLVGFQFLLGDPENVQPDDLKASGFDLPAIMDALESEPVLATKAPLVEARLPWE